MLLFEKTVNSHSIKRIWYNENTKNLFVKFKTDYIYSYDCVPLEIFNGLVGSASVGKYFAENVKGQYPHHNLGKIFKKNTSDFKEKDRILTMLSKLIEEDK